MWKIVTRDGRNGRVISEDERWYQTLPDGIRVADSLTRFLRSALSHSGVRYAVAGPVLPDCYGDLCGQERLTVSTFEINGKVLYLSIEQQEAAYE